MGTVRRSSFSAGAEGAAEEIVERTGHAHRLPCVETSYHDQDRGQVQRHAPPWTLQGGVSRRRMMRERKQDAAAWPMRRADPLGHAREGRKSAEWSRPGRPKSLRAFNRREPPRASRLEPCSRFGGPADPHVCGAVSGALNNGPEKPAVAFSSCACTLRAALGEGWTIQTLPKAVREDDSLPTGTLPAQACLQHATYPACRP